MVWPHGVLRKRQEGLLYGIWVRHVPAQVAPFASIDWESESHGLLTGTEGWVEFALDRGTGVVRVQWNNPYVGLNAYEQVAPAGYRTAHQGGAGHNALVIFELCRS
jgi:hypothetical protein